MPKDAETKMSKGFAFIEYSTPQVRCVADRQPVRGYRDPQCAAAYREEAIRAAWVHGTRCLGNCEPAVTQHLLLPCLVVQQQWLSAAAVALGDRMDARVVSHKLNMWVKS